MCVCVCMCVCVYVYVYVCVFVCMCVCVCVCVCCGTCVCMHACLYAYAGLHTGFRVGEGQIELPKILGGGGGNAIRECIGVRRLGGGGWGIIGSNAMWEGGGRYYTVGT